MALGVVERTDIEQAERPVACGRVEPLRNEQRADFLVRNLASLVEGKEDGGMVGGRNTEGDQQFGKAWGCAGVQDYLYEQRGRRDQQSGGPGYNTGIYDLRVRRMRNAPAG